MKKQVTVILLSALLMSGCATGRMSGDPSAIAGGAAIGGTLGNAIGGIIGENNNGWRGGYRGSVIGTIVGSIAGAAIGNAVTTPKQEGFRGIPPSVVQEDIYIKTRLRYSPDSLVQEKTIPALRLRNIRFIDDNRNQAIDAGENSKVIFEIMNEGGTPLYNIVPIVEQVSEMRHIGISPSVMIEEILPGEGIRYTATIYGGEKLRTGEAIFRIAVSEGKNGLICDSQEFAIPTRRGK